MNCSESSCSFEGNVSKSYLFVVFFPVRRMDDEDFEVDQLVNVSDCVAEVFNLDCIG